jgi:hypothetical protein
MLHSLIRAVTAAVLLNGASSVFFSSTSKAGVIPDEVNAEIANIQQTCGLLYEVLLHCADRVSAIRQTLVASFAKERGEIASSNCASNKIENR